MKVEIINDELINIFLNMFYFKDIDFNDKISVSTIVKDLIHKIQIRYKLNLNGFYKIKVYPNKELGVFLNIIKIDDNEFSIDADFRIIIYTDSKFLLETDIYEELEKEKEKIYYNDKFYIDVSDIKSNNMIFDIGNIIYGDDIKIIKNKGKRIK